MFLFNYVFTLQGDICIQKQTVKCEVSQDLPYRKSLKSINFYRVILKVKRWTFWDTA